MIKRKREHTIALYKHESDQSYGFLDKKKYRVIPIPSMKINTTEFFGYSSHRRITTYIAFISKSCQPNEKEQSINH